MKEIIIKIIKYKSNGDKHGNLSLEKYLNMIRPYLRDLINKHKPIEELNNTIIIVIIIIMTRIMENGNFSYQW